MNAENLFDTACIAENLSVVSKKQLLQEMAELAVNCGAVGDTGLQARDVVAAVMERERLGSTGFGGGVAIPHARLDGLYHVKAVFARLETPLDYDAVDDRPVDLVVLLLAPKNANSDHLKALAQISRLLRRTDMREKLRTAPGAGAIHLLLSEGRTVSAA